MVTLKKIKISNFLSHKDTEISFKENTKVSIEGKSGSGKSSIVEAIIWTLYGKARVENKNIIKRGAKFATVVLELSDENNSYRIERSVTMAGKHSLDVGEKKAKAYMPMKHIGLRDAQEWIEKSFLKSSYSLFINSVAYPQDNQESFVKQTASKRKELLLEIANIENYDDLYEKAKNKLDEIREGAIRFDMAIAGINSDILKAEILVKDLPELLLNFDLSSKEVLSIQARLGEARAAEDYFKEINHQIYNNNSSLTSLNSRIYAGKKDVENKKKKKKIEELKAIDPSVIEGKKTRLLVIRKALEKLNELKKEDYDAWLRRQAIIGSKRPQSDYSAVLKRLEGQLMDILLSNDTFCKDLGRNCPKLEQEVKNKSIFIEEQIKDIKERISNQEKESKEYETSLSAIPLPKLNEKDVEQMMELEKEEKELSVYENISVAEDEKKKTVDYLNKETQEMEITLIMLEEDVKKLRETNENMTKDLQNIKFEKSVDVEKISDAEKLKNIELKHKIEMANQATKEISDLKKKKEDLVLKNGKTSGEKESLEMIKEAFGSKGIKTVVVDYLIPRLEVRINDILSKMSDFKIRLETQKSKFDGEGITEGLFINVYNPAGECFSYDNYSGGEKLKITVAVSEALASLQKSGFRIFDEIFLGLDPDSIEGFNEVMHSLQDKFSQVLCISHLQTIKDSFEEKINVIKEGDASKII